MNDLYLTTIFASLFTIFYIFLSFRVGYFRGSPVMRLIFRMDDKINETKLVRNVRSHGNFSEYVPLFFILLLILEIKNETPFLYLLITCLIFLYGRFRCLNKDNYKDPLENGIKKTSLDGWSLTHLFFYMLIGFLYPNTFILTLIFKINIESNINIHILLLLLILMLILNLS